MSDALPLESQPGPTPGPTPIPFESFPVSPEVKAAIAALGYTTPTPVQAEVIAPGVAGKDLVVQSRTGSGKTSAFGIPLVERLSATGAPGAPLALALAPTRELAQQVATEVRALGSKKGLRVHAIYGGVPMGKQTAALKSGVDIVVGTPGRLLDHIRRKNLSLGSIQIAVLDEADEMLSMGFWDEVTELLNLMPKERQTMLFSATLPYEVAKAAAQYLKDPVRVDLSGDKLSVDGIDNFIYHVLPEMPKPRQLMYILEQHRPDSAIIFCNTRNETEMLAKFLTTSGFIAEQLSGSMKQKDRERVMARIKARDLRYMVATDIAARGIDINDLSHVFNYSLPEFTEVFLHRVGRTGRVGKLGTAVSLVDGVGMATLTRLEREFGIKFIEKVLPKEEEASRFRSERIMKELSEKAQVAEVTQHLGVAQEVLKSAEGPQIVAYLLKSYFNQQAQEAERRGNALVRGQQQSQPQPQAQANEQEMEAGDEGGAPGEGGRRRRRRRRRGRGRGEERGQAGANGGGYETMDALEALAGEGSAPVANGQASAPVVTVANGHAPVVDQINDGLTRLRVNIGFDDGFKGRGAVAKKISSLAGLNEASVSEVELKREYAVIKAAPDIAELLIDRVDGTPIGKKTLTLSVAK